MLPDRPRTRGRLLCGILALFVMTAAHAIGVAEQADRLRARYRVTDLGTLPGCDVTYATAVNDAGWVVGYAYKQIPPGHVNPPRPFLWRKGKMTELPKLGGEFGQALTINAQGDVGGYADTKDYEGQPVIWKRARGHVPMPLSRQAGSVTALLADGAAVGDLMQGGRRWAALWSGGKAQTVGNAQDVEATAYGVNASGTAVGFFIPEGGSPQSFASPGSRHAAQWKDGRQIALSDLGTEPAGRSGYSRVLSEARAINANGDIVGYSDGPEGRRACLWKKEKLEPLSAFKGYSTEAHSINKSGVIVGEAQEQADKQGWKWIACIWREGKQEDLNLLIPADSGWKLSVAAYISDRGLIVGYGTYDKYPGHYWRAFLLTPEKP